MPKLNVLLLFSGGVHSVAAARELLAAGHEVVGLHFAGLHQSEIGRARLEAAQLGINLLTDGSVPSVDDTWDRDELIIRNLQWLGPVYRLCASGRFQAIATGVTAADLADPRLAPWIGKMLDLANAFAALVGCELFHPLRSKP